MATDNIQTKPEPTQESDLHTEIRQRLPRWCAIVLDIEHKLDTQTQEKQKP
jgi:hypothetical protein